MNPCPITLRHPFGEPSQATRLTTHSIRHDHAPRGWRQSDAICPAPDLLAEQEGGINAFFVLVDEGAVLGRFNFYDLTYATAKLGYRVAEHVTGRGMATATVREVRRLAAADYGLRALMAATSNENVASQRMLTKSGFVRTRRAA